MAPNKNIASASVTWKKYISKHLLFFNLFYDWIRTRSLATFCLCYASVRSFCLFSQRDSFNRPDLYNLPRFGNAADRGGRTNPEICNWDWKRVGAIRSRNSCAIAARSFFQTVFLTDSGQAYSQLASENQRDFRHSPISTENGWFGFRSDNASLGYRSSNINKTAFSFRFICALSDRRCLPFSPVICAVHPFFLEPRRVSVSKEKKSRDWRQKN